MHADIRNHTAS